MNKLKLGILSFMNYSHTGPHFERIYNIQKYLSFHISRIYHFHHTDIKLSNKRLKYYNIKSYFTGSFIKFLNLFYFFKILVLVKNEKINVFYSYQIHLYLLAGLLISKIRGIVFISDFPSSIFAEYPELKKFRIKNIKYNIFYLIESLVLNNSLVVVPSQTLKDFFIKEFTIPPESFLICKNGVNLTNFSSKVIPKSQKEKLGINNSDFVIAYTCNTKYPFNIVGLKYFYTIFKKLREKYDNFKLLVIGTDDFSDILGDTRNIIGTGFIPFQKMPDYINMANVCISPYPDSTFSGGHIKVSEYMSCGKIVVGTKVGLTGFEDAVSKKIAYIASDELHFQELLINMMQNPQTASNIENIETYVRKEISWEAQVSNLHKEIRTSTELFYD